MAWEKKGATIQNIFSTIGGRIVPQITGAKKQKSHAVEPHSWSQFHPCVIGTEALQVYIIYL